MYQEQQNRHSQIFTAIYQGLGYNETPYDVKFF